MEYFAIFVTLVTLCGVTLGYVVGRRSFCLSWEAKDVQTERCFTTGNSPSATVPATTLSACALACMQYSDPSCFGANFRQSLGTCEIYGDLTGGTVTACADTSFVLLHGSRTGKASLPVTTSHGCDQGWSRYRDHCYRLFQPAATFVLADTTCRAQGAALASVHSFSENQFLSACMPRHGGSAYIGLIRQSDQPMWTDHTPYKYSHWHSTVEGPVGMGDQEASAVGAGGQEEGGGLCTSVSASCGNVWSHHNCGNKLPYICKKPKN